MVIKNEPEQGSSNKVRSAKARDLNLHDSMKSFLVSHDESLEDKIATVKTAQLVDSGRFETAFKTLMKR
jgi:hypothetical protein